jgi:hypothetical protein
MLEILTILIMSYLTVLVVSSVLIVVCLLLDMLTRLSFFFTAAKFLVKVCEKMVFL